MWRKCLRTESPLSLLRICHSVLMELNSHYWVRYEPLHGLRYGVFFLYVLCYIRVLALQRFDKQTPVILCCSLKSEVRILAGRAVHLHPERSQKQRLLPSLH
jgi:hypothetical protein